MLHDSPVIALALSRDSDLLASGSQDGKIKARHTFLCPSPMPMLPLHELLSLLCMCMHSF